MLNSRIGLEKLLYIVGPPGYHDISFPSYNSPVANVGVFRNEFLLVFDMQEVHGG